MKLLSEILPIKIGTLEICFQVFTCVSAATINAKNCVHFILNQCVLKMGCGSVKPHSCSVFAVSLKSLPPLAAFVILNLCWIVIILNTRVNEQKSCLLCSVETMNELFEMIARITLTFIFALLLRV